MHIELMTQVSDEIVAAFARLIPQLTDFSPPPGREALAEMAGSGSTYVFLARLPDQHGEIAGSATLATFRSPTGLHGWIEDVIVDGRARRQGVGKALTEACLEKARALGLREVNLTSRATRCAANQLYQAMGFIQRETNLYRYAFHTD
jgi:ribosomal protein S18 acetylase RimI-like enzyme